MHKIIQITAPHLSRPGQVLWGLDPFERLQAAFRGRQKGKAAAQIAAQRASVAKSSEEGSSAPGAPPMPGMPGKPCRGECLTEAMKAANEFTESLVGMDPIYRRTAEPAFYAILAASTGVDVAASVVQGNSKPFKITEAPKGGSKVTRKSLKRRRVKKIKPMKTIKRKPRRKSKRIHNIK